MKLSKEHLEAILQQVNSRLSSPPRNLRYDLMDDFDPTDLAIGESHGDRPEIDASPSPGSSSTGSPPSVIYMPKGINYARFYKDSQGNFLRMLEIHGHNNCSVPCLGTSDCEICERLDRIPSNLRLAYDYRRRSITICFAWYVKLSQPVIMWANEKFGEELRGMIETLQSQEAIRRFFDPHTNHRFLRIECDLRGVSIQMSWANNFRSTIDPLPQGFPPLCEAIWPDGQPPNPSDVDRLLKKIDRDYETPSWV